MAINRRNFLKLLGATLASVGVSPATAEALFPGEGEPQGKLLKDALRELAFANNPLGVIRLLGEAYMATDNLVIAGAGVSYTLRITAGLDPGGFALRGLQSAARKNREQPYIKPFLDALRQTLFPSGKRAKPVDYASGYSPYVIETEIVAAYWYGTSPEEQLDYLNKPGNGNGARIMGAYREQFGEFEMPEDADITVEEIRERNK